MGADNYRRKQRDKGLPTNGPETGLPSGTHSQKEEVPLSMGSSSGPSDKGSQSHEGALQAGSRCPANSQIAQITTHLKR